MSIYDISTDMMVKRFNNEVETWTAKNASHLPIETIQRKLALDVLRSAVFYTPVDTGYLRFNWQVGINKLPQEPIGERPKGDKKAPQNSATVGKLPKWSVVYLSNPVEYAEYVEEGTPRMQARKMLARALQDVVAEMQAGA